jgi:hypothetical protein
MELCSSFRILFEPFSVGFSSPCFSLWTTLMTGWVLWHRYVTDLIVSSDATDQGAWCNFHRFFSRYKWSLDEVCRVTAKLVIDTLVPRGAVITLAVDDTLCRKRGLGLFGAGMHHDAQIDLVVSPMACLFGFGRTQRVMMHSCPEDSQAALATQGVIAGKHDDGVFADEAIDDQFRQQSPEIIDLPCSL